MPKATVAERILETVTTSSRAASIVGDLLEEGSNRSPAWFWFGVLRIFASHVCRDLRIHWIKMIWLGFSGFLELFIVASLYACCRNNLPYRTAPDYLGNILLNLGNILLNVFGYGIPTLVGWHVARRSREHELASAVALASVFCIFVVGGLSLRRVMHTMPIITPFCTQLIVTAFLFRYRVNTRNRKFPQAKS